MDSDCIDAFLRAHPDWLAGRPDLYASLSPPRRVHGDTLADHMQARIDAERVRCEVACNAARDILQASRASACLTTRIQRSVLALLRASDAMDCILQELPSLLGIEYTRLYYPTSPTLLTPMVCERAGIEPMARTAMSALLGDKDVQIRSLTIPDLTLHRETAPLIRQDALLLLPRTSSASPWLMVLAARNREELAAPNARQALRFLAEATSSALDRDSAIQTDQH
ncbi:hypothetical protein [Granulibacter bethesdensis]|uniref:hypothetical protein n=1 Tax=Granulibacter bethesdensis TaxID=364410 RepID=UPI00090B5E88|nr:hypothetical protein [Granulibacter bethesdensis]APH60399.1 Hypothetical protein GbCGDNIH7_2061 [Granulibacter bethesdensis]